MKNSNADLVRFCIGKVGVPYVMGTNGRVLTKAVLNDLTRRNPGKWFTASRLQAVRSWVGKRTTDCHGLIEWFMAELAGGKWTYDVTADGAFNSATVKGSIGSIPELPGICVRYKGHVGVYIGGGYVVEARGFDYGVCISALKKCPWTHWYKHPKIRYAGTALLAPSPAKVGKTTDRYSIVWLQLALNRQIREGYITGTVLTVDGVYGKKTAVATGTYWHKKGWTTKNEVWGVGKNTVKALQKI
ncbi:MAG: hypothetical protein HFG79_12570 [Lachnospiraceae bacterium]|jgi:hypothetical protein|nr:hypothetical protein [Lachnospiraceae bacterium]